VDERFRTAVVVAWRNRVGAGDINAPPAAEGELRAFEAEFGPIPAEFRWFLGACGGGPVGSEWTDSIRELPATHRKFRSEFGPPRGWTLADVFVIGWDGSGNPYGIHDPTGRVLVEDHDFGGIHEMAPSFAAFLSDGLSLDAEQAAAPDPAGG
jgi:hypothetical protein